MPITHFLQLEGSNQDSQLQDSLFQKAIQNDSNLVLGTIIQEPSIVQIITESPDINTATAQHNVFRIDFIESLFSPNGPATSNVVEFVRNVFPASSITPDFQKKIETDFMDFIAGLESVKGRRGVVFGWTMDDDVHEDIENEKTRSFVVVTGWESMGDFERLLQREEFKKSIPILLSWKAPYKMWHAELKH